MESRRDWIEIFTSGMRQLRRNCVPVLFCFGEIHSIEIGWQAGIPINKRGYIAFTPETPGKLSHSKGPKFNKADPGIWTVGVAA
jgi:hypothetical protein